NSMQRREPTFDGGSSSSMDPQISASGPIGGKRYAAPEPPLPASGREPSSGGGSSFLSVLALLLALAGLGAAGFLYNQWQVTRLQLSDAESRIVQLEKRFEMS